MGMKMWRGTGGDVGMGMEMGMGRSVGGGTEMWKWILARKSEAKRS